MIELRQYTLRPGGRDVLVELFERELIEPQEASGMRVGGLFLDRDDADRFVWFRGFADMAARQLSLESFYFGPVWNEFRDAANSTMLDSDDVLLLRPADPARPAPEPAEGRASVGSTNLTDEWVIVSVYVHAPDPSFTRWLNEDFHGAVQQELDVPVATFRSEPAKNNFPALPVRTDNAFVWMAAFSDGSQYEDARRRLEGSKTWQDDLAPRLRAKLTNRECLRLQPTARSQHPRSGPAAGAKP
ncbi:NIPSNAP family protein [Kribbella sancticallisti]|uniref:NIPSNAP family protein n=1 Tax=Kribbella sancticallisti TaxID=460087 RepID=UPI0031D73407